MAETNSPSSTGNSEKKNNKRKASEEDHDEAAADGETGGSSSVKSARSKGDRRDDNDHQSVETPEKEEHRPNMSEGEKRKLEEKRAYSRMISQRARQRTKDEIVQLAAKAEKQTARVEELEAEVRKLKEQVQTVTADNTRLSQLCSRFVSSALAGQAAAAGGAGAPAAAQAAAVPAAANNYIPPHLLANAAFGGYGAGGFGAGALGGAYSPHDPYAAAAAYAGFPSAAYPGLGGLVPQPPMHMMAAPPGVSSSHAAAMALGAESERARLRAAGVNVDQGRRLSAAGSITGGAAPAGNSDAENQLLIQSLLGRRS